MIEKRKVILAISGGLIGDDLRVEDIREIAKALISLLKKDFVVIATVGGGGRARNYIKIAKELGASEIMCDMIGIDVTRINARLLIAALGSYAHPEPIDSYGDAINIADRGKIVVMCGNHPGHTTDAVAATMAEYCNADLLIVLTPVGGIYDKDPEKFKDAKKLDRISFKDLAKFAIEKDARCAGERFVIDSLAAKIIQRSKIKTIFIGPKDLKKLSLIVKGKEKVGTVVR